MNPDLVEITETETTLRAADIDTNEVSLGVTGWDRHDDAATFDDPVDERIAGRVSEIRHELQNWFEIERLDGRFTIESPGAPGTSVGRHRFGVDTAVHASLPAGSYRCVSDEDLVVRLRFEGAGTVRYRPSGSLVISFPHPTTVTIGFQTYVEFPRHELTIEPTPMGVAEALSVCSSPFETESPDRVHREYRGYPPEIRLGETTDIPPAVADADLETGVRLVVPGRIEPLLRIAPLAYYFGADVEVAAVDRPRLEAAGERYPLGAGTDLESAVVDWVRRTFFLDLLTSWLDEDEPHTVEHDELEAAGIDLSAFQDAGLADRLVAYRELSGATLEAVVPTWPYRVTVDPVVDSTIVLPHLLYDLATIELPADREPESSRVRRDGREPMARFRSITRLQGRVRSTLAEGGSGFAFDHSSPSPSFIASPVAYENRLRYLHDSPQELAVAIVCTEAADARTASRLRARYQRRDDVVTPDVRMLEEPTCVELADVFERGANFMHVIGENPGAGIRCADGILNPATLEENAVELCYVPEGGAEIGATLVETGSVAAIVDDPAADSRPSAVGELVLYGQSVATASACAGVLRPGEETAGNRRGPTVIGDGTHRFTHTFWPRPIHVLEDTEGGTRLSVVPFPVDPVGGHWYPSVSEDIRLQTAVHEYTLDGETLTTYLANCSYPIYHDGRLYWPAEHGYLAYPIA